MKIKCPLCGCENYFTGLEDKGTKFCSNCNTPLVEPNIPDNTENPYVKIKKEKPDTNFPGPKKMLDIKTFCNILIDWVVATFKIGRKGLFQSFLKDIEKFGADKIMEDKFFEEIIYFYMWLAYINCVDICQNKTNYYFSYFVEKMHGLIFNMGFGGYEKEKWIKNLMEKLNRYTYAYNLSIENKNFSPLGREFYKNLYGGEVLGFTNEAVFTVFVIGELEISFKTLGKELTKYKI